MTALAFEPYDLAGAALKNRIVMAPMTRTRAVDAVPGDLVAEYYAQRAGAGLIVTEGTAPSAIGLGYPDTPGIYSLEQVAAWRNVTDAVHAEDGVIFLQLMHAGRISDPALHPGGAKGVAPSAVAAEGEIYTHEGMIPYVAPEALSEDGIHDTIADYVSAARNAIGAGFDGVELHGANGYLIHQFLSSSANHRDDEWGGDIPGRIRFGVEVAKAVADAIGSERVGFRISPANPLHSIAEDDSAALYAALIRELTPLGLAYLHVSEARGGTQYTDAIVAAWPGTLILNPFTEGRPTAADELALLESKDGVDLIAFGANFIGTPDLPLRLRTGAELNPLRPGLFYGIGPEGYTDYPALNAASHG